MSREINELTELAYEGTDDRLTVTPVVGRPERTYPQVLVPGTEDLTVFNITKEAVVTRRASIDPFARSVIGQSSESGLPISAPHDPPA